MATVAKHTDVSFVRCEELRMSGQINKDTAQASTKPAQSFIIL